MKLGRQVLSHEHEKRDDIMPHIFVPLELRNLGRCYVRQQLSENARREEFRALVWHYLVPCERVKPRPLGNDLPPYPLVVAKISPKVFWLVVGIPGHLEIPITGSWRPYGQIIYRLFQNEFRHRDYPFVSS